MSARDKLRTHSRTTKGRFVRSSCVRLSLAAFMFAFAACLSSWSSAQSYILQPGWRVAPSYPPAATRQVACQLYDETFPESFHYDATNVHCPGGHVAGGEGPGV